MVPPGPAPVRDHCAAETQRLSLSSLATLPCVTVARFLLVRHGQSTWNAAARWQGRADPPLTEAGQLQAAAAAEALGAVDAIVSSTLQRAHHTAAIISELLGVGPVHLDDRLVERDAGEWTGLTGDEIDVRYPGDREAWRTPPGFEDDDQLLARVGGALVELAERFEGGEVIAVTHGGVIFALEKHLTGDARRIPNLGAQWIEVGVDGAMRLGDRVPLLAEHGPAPTKSDVTEQV